MSTGTPEDGSTHRPGSGAMFDAIARKYDRLNRVLSLGLDARWRRRLLAAIEELGGRPDPANDAVRVLDLATGTGDVAIAALTRWPNARVTGADPSEGMLAIARDKLAARRLDPRFARVVAEAEALPFPDASFDVALVAFGIRNMPDRKRALLELARVLAPGGRLGILELGEPRGRLVGAAARLYVHTVVPRIGALLSGRADEYAYLPRSIEALPPPDVITAMMREAGLTGVRHEPLWLGAANLFTARTRERG